MSFFFEISSSYTQLFILFSNVVDLDFCLMIAKMIVSRHNPPTDTENTYMIVQVTE